MARLTTSSQRKVASGASVRERNHMERWSGALVEQNTLPSAPAVFHSRPISRTSVRMPAWPRRRAATAPPYPEPTTMAGELSTAAGSTARADWRPMRVRPRVAAVCSAAIPRM